MIERALCYTTKATLRVVREIIGKRTLALAAKGERDPERLSNSALVAAAQRRSRLLVFEEVSPAIFFAFLDYRSSGASAGPCSKIATLAEPGPTRPLICPVTMFSRN